MGYETYLVQMLQPLGVYDLSEGKINRAELAVYGTQMDLGADHLEDSGREMCLATAEGFGLERVEELLPYRPASNNLGTAQGSAGRSAAYWRRQLYSRGRQRYFGWLWHQRQGQGDGKPQLCTGVLSRRTWHSRQV